MKKIFLLLITASFLSLLSACGGQAKTNVDQGSESTQTESGTADIVQPDLAQIRSICELSTLECYYHNVAKSVKTKGSGLLHLGEKERTFWIEYTGVAKIGIDMSKVTMTLKDHNATITIPQAELLSYKVDTINSDNYIFSADGFFNKNPITAQEQTEAVDKAQKEMKSNVEQNDSLLATAQERAKTLIQNYIDQLGETSGVKYTITWEYSSDTDTTSNTSNQTTETTKN